MKVAVPSGIILPEDHAGDLTVRLLNAKSMISGKCQGPKLSSARSPIPFGISKI
jgi:hypothetical protein